MFILFIFYFSFAIHSLRSRNCHSICARSSWRQTYTRWLVTSWSVLLVECQLNSTRTFEIEERSSSVWIESENSFRLENYILQYLFMREEEEEKLFVGASALLPSHRGRLPVFLASPATWARYWFYFILFFILINEWMNAVVIAGMKPKRWSSTSTQWLGFNRIDQRWFIDIAFSLILWAYNFAYRLHLHWNQSKNCF